MVILHKIGPADPRHTGDCRVQSHFHNQDTERQTDSGNAGDVPRLMQVTEEGIKADKDDAGIAGVILDLFRINEDFHQQDQKDCSA